MIKAIQSKVKIKNNVNKIDCGRNVNFKCIICRCGDEIGSQLTVHKTQKKKKGERAMETNSHVGKWMAQMTLLISISSFRPAVESLCEMVLIAKTCKSIDDLFSNLGTLSFAFPYSKNLLCSPNLALQCSFCLPYIQEASIPLTWEEPYKKEVIRFYYTI